MCGALFGLSAAHPPHPDGVGRGTTGPRAHSSGESSRGGSHAAPLKVQVLDDRSGAVWAGFTQNAPPTVGAGGGGEFCADAPRPGFGRPHAPPHCWTGPAPVAPSSSSEWLRCALRLSPAQELHPPPPKKKSQASIHYMSH